MSQEEIDELKRKLEEMKMAEEKKEKLVDPDWKKEEDAKKSVLGAKPSTPTDKPADKPADKKPVLNLQDQVIPNSAWIPLPEEFGQLEKDKLIDSLIAYIHKIDFPPRFKNLPEALMYFEIRTDAQINRINKLAEELKKKSMEPVVATPPIPPMTTSNVTTHASPTTPTT